MRNKENCPVCGSNEIYYRNVRAVGGYGPDLLPDIGGIMTRKYFESFICGNCGFYQLFVPEPLLSMVKDKYKRKT